MFEQVVLSALMEHFEYEFLIIQAGQHDDRNCWSSLVDRLKRLHPNGIGKRKIDQRDVDAPPGQTS